MIDIHKLGFGYLINQLVSNFYKPQAGFPAFIQYLIAPVIIFTLLAFLLIIIRKALAIKNLLKEPSVLLELTPPSFTEKQSYTTDQLFSIIHALGNQRSFKDRLLGNQTRFSLEIVSTKDQGIIYLVRTSPKQVNTLKKSLLAYLPHLKVETVNEYLPRNLNTLNKNFYKIMEFKLSKHFAFSLKRQSELEKHDPIAYLTGQMTKLAPGELISLQIVVSSSENKGTKKISKLISSNGDVVKYLKTPAVLKWIFYNSYRAPKTKSLSDMEIVNSIDSKINQPLFDTTIRLLMTFKDSDDLSQRVQGFKSSFSTFSSTGYQSLVTRRSLNIESIKDYQFYAFKKRMLSLTKTSTLSISEVSDIYHFPFTSITKTENIVKSHSKELPAPLSLKKENNLDVVFAKNTYGGTITQIGLTNDEREKHMYIIGATGMGKSTMILSIADKDIKSGKGVCIIDPHGDLAESAISLVPKKRAKDFIYFNPDDIRHPIGINLLELTPGLDEDDILREKELITESVVSLFRKIFSEVWSAHAHRLEYILRNTTQTALTLESPTLFTVYELLTNPIFQKGITNNLEDENLKNFWKYEFGKAGDYQKVKMIGPITSRIGRFLFSPSAKRILEQKKSTINFEQILDEGKILICNLSKGKLGEDTSEVLGILILTKIQLAALKRARVSQEKRRPFYLYVDEFQSFATPSFIQMLSEARKYKVFLTMAEQSTSQQKDRNLVNVVLANVGTVVSFRSANPEDEKLMLPQFAPYVEQGEIANLPVYRFYMKISAISPEESFSGETIPITINEDNKKVEGLIQASRDNFAIVYQKPKHAPAVSRSNKNRSIKDNDYSKSVNTLS